MGDVSGRTADAFVWTGVDMRTYEVLKINDFIKFLFDKIEEGL